MTAFATRHTAATRQRMRTRAGHECDTFVRVPGHAWFECGHGHVAPATRRAARRAGETPTIGRVVAAAPGRPAPESPIGGTTTDRPAAGGRSGAIATVPGRTAR